VQTSRGVEKRQLLLGMTNDKMVEVKDGVAEGDKVVLNPRNLQQESEAVGAEGDKEEPVDAKEKFGEAKPGDNAAQSAGAGQGGGASGGSSGGARSGPPSFKDLDKDGDGKITREENPSPFFDRMDANSDGVIDRSEHAAMMKRMRERQQNGGGAQGGPPGGGGPPQ
jgi:HlyD family secretion protein